MNILVSYNWLKHYVAIKDSPEDLVRKLSLCGPSVERINHIKPQFTGVIIGRILDIQKHPNADKLQLAKVAIKEKNYKTKDILEIVCGAPNIRIGDKVPVALVGATLASSRGGMISGGNGLVISERDVRGVKSRGMLCSEKELGISDNQSGILILPEDAPVGTDFAKAFDLEDFVFDAEITTNRPDALGMIGFAREAAAITGAKFLWREPTRKLRITNYELQKNNSRNKIALSIKIEDKKACPRYMAAAMDNIKVKESPLWLKKRLLAAGLRPINNIVDITNYVMLEYGQPLHAFDFDKIENFSVSPFIKGGLRGIFSSAKEEKQKLVKNIIVRRAKNGEEIETLDGVKRKLTMDNLAIADSVKPIAVAGVMGGANSAVDENTKNIVIEAANFNPTAIRKSARDLNLHTDSSSRFEKLLSVEFPRLAILRAIELVEDLAGGKIASKINDVKNIKHKSSKVKLEYSYLWEKLGVEIPPAKELKILKDLGFKIIANNKKQLIALPPYWREGDAEIAEDLVEEIARIYGYHNLPSTLPKGDIPLDAGYINFEREERAKDLLSDLGFTEVYGNSMVSEKMLADSGLKTANALKIKNPLSEDLVFMRISLMPSLLKTMAQNSKYKKEANIFEMANIYRVEAGKDLPKEEMTLALAKSGVKNSVFGEIKGVFEALSGKFGISQKHLKYVPMDKIGWHPGRAAIIKIADSEIGVIGEIHPLVLKKFGLATRAAAAELNWEMMAKFATNKKIYAPIAKFPAVKMDLAIVLDKKIYWRNILEEVLAVDPLIAGVEFLSEYDETMEEGKKSIAFHITYQSAERTLKDEEIKKITDKIVERLKNKFGAELRK